MCVNVTLLPFQRKLGKGFPFSAPRRNPKLFNIAANSCTVVSESGAFRKFLFRRHYPQSIGIEFAIPFVALQSIPPRRNAMIAQEKRLLDLSARDLMSHNPIVLHQTTSVRDAARTLIQASITGAPVVNAEGRCVGVISATDFVRLTWPGKEESKKISSAGYCQFLFQAKQADGTVKSWCTLPAGACLLQGPMDQQESMPQCSLPRSVFMDGQIVDVEELPGTSIRSLMTADPVTVHEDVSVRTLARMMMEAHIHRIIVVDDNQHPVGIVSSTDILAAVARAED
jgi:CBS domain-containing protein